MPRTRRSRTYRGMGIAPGVAVGPARIVDVGHFPLDMPRHSIAPADVERETQRFLAACAKAREDLNELADRIEQQLGRREADLIRPQAMMVEDPAFVEEVEQLIATEHCNAEAAVAQIIERFESLLSQMDDTYLRERSSDVRDAGRRILGNLLFVEGDVTASLPEPCIVVASHLVPSLAVRLDREKVLGLATEHGGSTSHAAILARALGIPAVTGLEGLEDDVINGEWVVVNGSRGSAVARPTRAQLERATRLSSQYARERRRIVGDSERPALTRDGARIIIQANVGQIEEIALAQEYHADGIGLYRTEFEFLTRTSLPGEDALCEHYSRVVDSFPDHSVAIRVLDVGGDKFPPSIPLAHEENPFLGVRGIRLLLERAEELMLPQLRAILRASTRGNVSIVYPMVGSVEEVVAARGMLRRAAKQLDMQDTNILQGIMVEVPSCVPMLKDMLEHVEFASVGTNDLVQYLLAADRNSERVASVYEPFHPAVLRTLEVVCATSAECESPVSVCGEIASDAVFLPLLLGLGYRTVSVNVGAIPQVKDTVRRLSVTECERLVAQALRAATKKRVFQVAEQFARRHGTA